MSISKEFAVWLSKCIFIRHMDNERIFSAAEAAWKIEDKEWLTRQIHTVLTDPTYRELATHQ